MKDDQRFWTRQVAGWRGSGLTQQAWSTLAPPSSECGQIHHVGMRVARRFVRPLSEKASSGGLK